MSGLGRAWAGGASARASPSASPPQALRVPGPSVPSAQGGPCEAAAGHYPPCPARQGDAPRQALLPIGCHCQQLGQAEV